MDYRNWDPASLPPKHYKEKAVIVNLLAQLHKELKNTTPHPTELVPPVPDEGSGRRQNFNNT